MPFLCSKNCFVNLLLAIIMFHLYHLLICVQVETITCNFKSLDHYLRSYHVPLIEETRSDLCSCLEIIREAPSLKILSMEVAGKSGSYFMDVDFGDNEAGSCTEAYAARNGDIFILSSMKPEAAKDLDRHGVTY